MTTLVKSIYFVDLHVNISCGHLKEGLFGLSQTVLLSTHICLKAIKIILQTWICSKSAKHMSVNDQDFLNRVNHIHI